MEWIVYDFEYSGQEYRVEKRDGMWRWGWIYPHQPVVCDSEPFRTRGAARRNAIAAIISEQMFDAKMRGIVEDYGDRKARAFIKMMESQ